MPNDKAKELTARELIALERGDELEPVATCKDYLQVQDALQARITELEQQLETAKAHAVVWHKYPDEKPVNGGYYITYNGKNVEAHFWRGGAEYWADMASSEDDIIINKVHDITHWACLPAPPEEASND